MSSDFSFSYSAPLFNMSLSPLDLAQLSDNAAADGSRELCLVEMAATITASGIKCLAQPLPQWFHDGHEESGACYAYTTTLRGFPFAFDASSGGSIVAGALYSVSTHLTVVSVALPDRPKLHVAEQFSSLSCESFVMFRRRVSFAYLVQAEGHFDDHLLKGDDAIVLQLQWRHPSPCKGSSSSSCVFFPNSTVNAGRNQLLQQLLVRFPDVHPNFVIFMDEDAGLLMREDGVGGGSAWRAHREFERLLLQWQPAIGVPYHSWHTIQQDLAVQTVDHFDHIVVALHDEVVDYYLPTETRFDSMCWWYGQAVYSIISSMFFPNNTLQFNTIVSINTGARPLSLEGVAEASSKYKKRTDFYHSLTWILSSVKSLPLLNNIDITIEASLFTYGTLANKGNRCTSAAAPAPCALGAFPTQFAQIRGCIPPIRWVWGCCGPAPAGTRRLLSSVLDAGEFVFVFAAAAAHGSQHGFRTVHAGPQALWNADISANDWLMQVCCMYRSVFIPVILSSRVPDL